MGVIRYPRDQGQQQRQMEWEVIVLVLRQVSWEEEPLSLIKVLSQTSPSYLEHNLKQDTQSVTLTTSFPPSIVSPNSPLNQLRWWICMIFQTSPSIPRTPVISSHISKERERARAPDHLLRDVFRMRRRKPSSLNWTTRWRITYPLSLNLTTMANIRISAW